MLQNPIAVLSLRVIAMIAAAPIALVNARPTTSPMQSAIDTISRFSVGA